MNTSLVTRKGFSIAVLSTVLEEMELLEKLHQIYSPACFQEVKLST
jgi:hypothetical protein